MPAMLGCSTVCPNCKHQFTCCAPVPPSCCSSSRRSLVLSGGGLVTALPPSCTSPQVSPSVPLVFVLPPPVRTEPPPITPPECELAQLSDTIRALRLSGWYYEGLTFERSDAILKETKVGTFLVRNSADPRYLFSLSVQTERGPRSVRLFYTNGYFRLEAQPHLQASMPLFPGVVELVQHYVRRRKDAQVWVDPRGKCLASIVLVKPLRREAGPPSLKHLARIAINRQMGESPKIQTFKLELPTSLKTYLLEYPYSL